MLLVVGTIGLVSITTYYVTFVESDCIIYTLFLSSSPKLGRVINNVTLSNGNAV